ncbi:hypothetical protein [Marinifilum flexuosum]|uniref:Uncharacterized protein n=1 Tax=Marinifilum flexuosum TaxID=1117708 RepID=A0A419WMW4_9BACT|nr:hypothetical protein [Marinifilum flexuosum]RKD96754.1 hypothetical protein BXY64_3700 [Marinifilum flexuosum]
MKQIVLDALESLTQEKKDAKQFPTHVLELDLNKEIRKRLKSALHELRREEKIRFGETLNNNFFELIETKK